MKRPRKKLSRVYQDRAGLYNTKLKVGREYVMYSEADYFLAEYVIYNNLPNELLEDLRPKEKEFDHEVIKKALIKGEEYERVTSIGDFYAVTSYGRILNSKKGGMTKPIVTGSNIIYTLGGVQLIVAEEFEKNKWKYNYEEIVSRFDLNKWPYKDIRNKVSYYEPRSVFRKPVLQYDLEGNFIKEYESVNHVKEETGFKTGIRECCRGIRKDANGYVWKYK